MNVMRLHILRGSLWLAYDIVNPSTITRLLPTELKLADVPLLGDDSCDDTTHVPKLLFNAYGVTSNWMNGYRVDIQTIAKHRNDGTLHLVVLDCITNTLQWDPCNGVQWPNARVYHPPIHADVSVCVHARKTPSRKLIVHGTLGEMRPIDTRFAVEANRVCYFRNTSSGFPMRFDETHVARPVRTLLLDRIQNDFWKEYRSDEVTHAFVHESPMEFDIEVPSWRRLV